MSNRRQENARCDGWSITKGLLLSAEEKPSDRTSKRTNHISITTRKKFLTNTIVLVRRLSQMESIELGSA
jgi:hypothetical protein